MPLPFSRSPSSSCECEARGGGGEDPQWLVGLGWAGGRDVCGCARKVFLCSLPLPTIRPAAARSLPFQTAETFFSNRPTDRPNALLFSILSPLPPSRSYLPTRILWKYSTGGEAVCRMCPYSSGIGFGRAYGESMF